MLRVHAAPTGFGRTAIAVKTRRDRNLIIAAHPYPKVVELSVSKGFLGYLWFVGSIQKLSLNYYWVRDSPNPTF